MQPIVVGIDGSEASEHALHWAAEEARLRGAVLRVVHTWFEVFVSGPFAAPAMVEQDAIEHVARDVLDKAVASIPDGSPPVQVEPVLVHGQAEVALLHEGQNAALIVVGSRGRGGFAGLLLGSVSQHVVQRATCPVVVVH